MGRIYKDIGFAGLWNGLPVRIVMIGTLTGLQWMIYVSGPASVVPFRLTLATGLLQDFHGSSHYRRSSAKAGEGLVNSPR